MWAAAWISSANSEQCITAAAAEAAETTTTTISITFDNFIIYFKKLFFVEWIAMGMLNLAQLSSEEFYFYIDFEP